jgi:hypothetical protein
LPPILGESEMGIYLKKQNPRSRSEKWDFLYSVHGYFFVWVSTFFSFSIVYHNTFSEVNNASFYFTKLNHKSGDAQSCQMLISQIK